MPPLVSGEVLWVANGVAVGFRSQMVWPLVSGAFGMGHKGFMVVEVFWVFFVFFVLPSMVVAKTHLCGVWLQVAACVFFLVVLIWMWFLVV